VGHFLPLRDISYIRDTNDTLTANEIELVRASFAQVVLIEDTAADLFYDRLFAIAPNLRRLFPVDMREQKRKLIRMIATAVGGLNNLDRLVPAVKALGVRHSGYGVTVTHYELVGESLLWTLERALGKASRPRFGPLGPVFMLCSPAPCRRVLRKATNARH
jgi:hemoglobin-like flavoprotein